MRKFSKVNWLFIILALLLFAFGTKAFATRHMDTTSEVKAIEIAEDKIVEEKHIFVYQINNLSRAQNPTYISSTAWIDKAYPLSNNEKVRWYVHYANGKKYEGWLNYTGKYRNLRVVANVLYKAEFEFKGTLYPAK